MKKEKLILAIVSLAMIAGSIVGLNLLVGHIQGQTVVEKVVTEEKEKKNEEEGITEKPFQVLVSGIHSSDFWLSDLNLLLTVNPVSKEILITNIPRDTYVKVPELSDDEFEGVSKKDIKKYQSYEMTRLSHLGMWGPLSLTKAVGGFLDTNVDYYIRMTMSGFSTLVDAVGGVDVEVAQGFETDWGTSYKKGDNHVNGKEALAFVAERHHFMNGEEARCENQVLMMKSVIEKLQKNSVLEMDIDALYQLFKKNVKTNMSAGEILSLIRMQVADRAEWTVKSVVIEGEAQLKPISDLDDFKGGVIVPEKKTVKKVQEKIQNVLQLEK